MKEFIDSCKGFKGILITLAITILLQVGTFLFLWGGLVTTVKVHDKNIDDLTAMLKDIKIVGVVYAKGEKGETGLQGIQGIPGKKE